MATHERKLTLTDALQQAQVGRPWRWLLVLVWMGGIFLLSAQPTLPSLPDSTLDVLLKKSAHFGAYAGLAALVWWALPPRRGAHALAWLLSVTYACSDELHQSFVPGRHPAATDVLIDACGAAAALLVLLWLQRRAARAARATTYD